VSKNAKNTLLLILISVLGPSIVRAQTCDVAVPATIVDAQTGMYIRSITPAMLHARIGGKFFPAVSADPIKTFRVLVLVDSSGSMSGEQPYALSYKKQTIAKMREAIAGELSSLPQGVQVGFGMFNEQAAFGNEFTSDSGHFQQIATETAGRLKRREHGGTALLDALQESLTQFGSPQPGDTVLLITDGGENKSKVNDKEVARQFARAGVRVFVLLARDQSPAQPEEAFGDLLMSGLAERTGGSMYAIETTNVFWGDKKWATRERESLSRFWKEQVLSAYLVHFNVPADLKKDQKWRLEVDHSANPHRNMAAAYPSRLEGCAVKAAAR
jgi:hypothetical protein